MILEQLSPITPQEESKENTAGEVVDAAFRQSNVIGSSAYGFRDDRTLTKVFGGEYSALENMNKLVALDPKYDFKQYMPEEHAAYVESYAQTRSPEEADALNDSINKELADKQILANNPVSGTLFTIAAALSSPEQFPLYALPGSHLIKGKSLARSFGIAAAAGAAEAALSEIYLQEAQATRTDMESMFNIGGSAVFAGTLGTIGAAMAGGTKVLKNTDGLMQKESAPGISTVGPIVDFDGKFTPEHLTAAKLEVDQMIEAGTVKAVDAEAMTASVLDGYKRNDNRLKHPKTYKLLGFMNPGVRMMGSQLSEARDFTSKLISSPLQMVNNRYGKATISAEVKADQMIAEVSSKIHLASSEAYAGYTQAGGKMSRKEFLDQVGISHSLADKSSDPFVTQAAKANRAIMKPIEQDLLDAEILRKGYTGWEDLDWHTVKQYLEPDDVKEVYFRKDGKPRANILSKLDNKTLDGLMSDLHITGIAEQPKGDLSYYHHRWDQTLLKDNRNKFRTKLKSNLHNSMMRDFSESIESLQADIAIRKAKLKKSGPTAVSTGQSKRRTPEQMLQAVEDKLSKVVKDFQETKAPKFDSEVDQAVTEIYNSITHGNYRARKGYKLTSFEAGPLKERIIDLPFSEMSEWLEKDPNRVWYHYMRDMAPRLAMKQTFGDEDAAEAISSVLRAFDKKLDKADAKTERSLKRAQSDFKRDATAMVEQMHNRYAQPANPDSVFSHAGQFIRNHNLMAKLGLMTFAALPDVGHVVMRHGARMLKFGPEVFSFSKAAKANREFMHDMGLAMDLYNSKRVAEMNMLNSDFSPRSQYQKTMAKATTGMSKWTGMNLWNSQLKTVVGILHAKGILRDAQNVATMSSKNLARYAQGGLSKSDLEKIAKYGKNQSIPEINNWPDKALATRFKQAIFKEAETTIVSPGLGDLPLVSKGEVGRLVFQFKSFAVAANHRMMLATLDDMTAQKMVGLGTALFFGYVSYAARQAIKGDDIATDFDTVVKESIDRSGFLSQWLSVNTLVERATEGNVDAFKMMGLKGSPTTRYQFDSTLGVALGPWLSTAKNAQQVVGAVSSGQMEERDWRAMRRLVWLNNHFLLHRGFTEIEKRMP